MKSDTENSSNNKKICISADASFYICFASDLNRRDWLYMLMKLYSFFLGNRILEEISSILNNDDTFMSLVTIVDVDYYELIKPYFGRKLEHLEDGEYEAIGIAYYLYILEQLGYLILDDRRARNFVKRHFPYLANRLVGTVGFIRDSCCKDKMLSPSCSLEILIAIKKSVKEGRKRPCGIDEKAIDKILMPIIEHIMRGCKDG